MSPSICQLWSLVRVHHYYVVIVTRIPVHSVSYSDVLFVGFVFSVRTLPGVAGQLGVLPPPELLISLPVCTPSIPTLTSSANVTPTIILPQLTTTTPMLSMPLELTSLTPASGRQTTLINPLSTSLHPHPPPLPPGMILSPAADPIPHGLV